MCQCLPDQLKDETFSEVLKDDKSTKHWLTMLLKNLENMTPGQQGSGNGQAGQNMNTIGVNKNLTGGPKLPGGLWETVAGISTKTNKVHLKQTRIFQVVPAEHLSMTIAFVITALVIRLK